MRVLALAVVLLACTRACAAQITCPAELQGTDARPPAADDGDALLSTLLRWCAADERCALLYHQTQRQNMTVFRHLVEPVLHGGGAAATAGIVLSPPPASYYGAVRALLCTGASLDDVNRRLWLLVLAAEHDRAQPICDVNHQLVLERDALRWQCVCRPDRICSDRLFELVPFYILLALVALAALTVAVSAVYRAVQETRTLRRTHGARTALKALRQAAP